MDALRVEIWGDAVDATTLQPEGINNDQRVQRIGVWMWPTLETNGIAGQECAPDRVVVPEPVVIEAGLRVLVLTGPAEGAGGAGAGDVAQVAVGVDGRGPGLRAGGVVHRGGR